MGTRLFKFSGRGVSGETFNFTNERFAFPPLSFEFHFISRNLIHLVTLFSSKYFPRSASFMSRSLFSNTPLNGIRIAPGSFLSTHSLILINLKYIYIYHHDHRIEMNSDDNMIKILPFILFTHVILFGQVD